MLCAICSRTDIPDTFWIDTMCGGDEQFIKLILSYRKIPIKFFIYLDEYSFFEEMLEHKNYTSSDIKDALKLLANTKHVIDDSEKKDHFEMLLYEMDEEI